MIPKIIHYCWFGGSEKPKEVIDNINSWKHNCPDYSILEWNESNFDVNICPYVKEAYSVKKWAFVTDYVRLYALFNYGGIYMDSDVKVLKNFDFVLENEAFSGFESEENVPTATMGSEKNNKMILEFLNYYDGKHFINEDGTYNQTTNVLIITNILKTHGLKKNNTKQIVDGFTLYPFEFFCAKDYNTGRITVTKNTYTIHNFSASWRSENTRRENKLRHFLIRFFNEKTSMKISKNLYGLKRHGFIATINLYIKSKKRK